MLLSFFGTADAVWQGRGNLARFKAKIEAVLALPTFQFFRLEIQCHLHVACNRLLYERLCILTERLPTARK